MSLILGLETSCDETAAAVVQDGRWVLSNVVSTQNDLHEKYRGVVPEIASRAHLERILPVIDEALAQAGIVFSSGTAIDDSPRITAISVGNRPGLIGSLLVGVSAAKALAWSLGVPIVGVDHIQAHLYAAALEFAEDADHRSGRGSTVPLMTPTTSELGFPTVTHSTSNSTQDLLKYPALGLVVSGGHTSLFVVSSPTRARLIGRTIDDAVGEAYDKAAVILDAGYPGGPKLDALARKGNPKAESLPRSLLSSATLDFSFSGLKTSLLYKVRGHPIGRGEKAIFPRSNKDLSPERRADLAAAFQQAAIETLIIKLERALDVLSQNGESVWSIVLGGGVSANSLLREMVKDLEHRRGIPVLIPAMPFCLDNAAMIAGLAHHHLAEGHHDDLELPAIASS